RQQLRRTSVDGHRVQVQPAVLFPGKDQAIAGAPEQLVVCDDYLYYDPVAFVGLPDLSGRSGLDVGHANGPGLVGFAAGRKHRRPRSCELPDVSHARTVGRPCDLTVAIE